MIYVFGNSHSHFFTNSHPSTHGWGNVRGNLFSSFSLGPTIAYNFYQNHYPRVLSELSSVKFNHETDYILLAVGEVDCRWHIPKQAELQNRDVDELVVECVERFFETHLDLKKRGYNVIAWGGHPSTTQNHSDDMSSPIYGDCFLRNGITLMWDSHIKKLSNIHNIHHISIVDNLIDSVGLTRMDYFMDYCHLNERCFNEVFIPSFKLKNI